MRDHNEDAAVLAVVSAASDVDASFWEWHRIADTLEEVGSAIRVISGDWDGFEPEVAHRLHHDAISGGAPTKIQDYQSMLRTLNDEGYQLTTITDRSYPSNLRMIFNRPPFLFVQGSIEACDRRSVAIVGTRNASPEGRDTAAEISAGLTRQGVTIISGMALGIDTEAHLACLDSGGITIAVAGTGIRITYPPANADLRSLIAQKGAVVSQFWPDAPPRPFHFPMRNIVTSGLSVATVVIEAGKTSGARNQARRALEHGKHLFLMRTLVETQEWAAKYSERPRTAAVETADEIIGILDEVLTPPDQLTLT